MQKKIKTYCFDIDGVICFTKKNYYHNSKPNKKVIKKINQIYEGGNKVIIFTARFMSRSNENFLTNHNLFSLRIYQKNDQHKHFLKEISSHFFFLF